MEMLLVLLGLVVTIAFIALPFMVYSIMGHVKRIRTIQELRFKNHLRTGVVTRTELNELKSKGLLWNDDVQQIMSDRAAAGLETPVK